MSMFKRREIVAEGDQRTGRRLSAGMALTGVALSATACVGHGTADPKPTDAKPTASATVRPKPAALPLPKQYDLAFKFVDNTSNQIPTTETSPTPVNINPGIANVALRQLVIRTKNEGIADAILMSNSSSASLGDEQIISKQTDLITDPAEQQTTRLYLAQSVYANYLSDLELQQPDSQTAEDQLLSDLLSADPTDNRTFTSDVQKFTSDYQTFETDQSHGKYDESLISQIQDASTDAGQVQVRTESVVDDSYQSFMTQIEAHSPLYQASPTTGP